MIKSKIVDLKPNQIWVRENNPNQYIRILEVNGPKVRIQEHPNNELTMGKDRIGYLYFDVILDFYVQKHFSVKIWRDLND